MVYPIDSWILMDESAIGGVYPILQEKFEYKENAQWTFKKHRPSYKNKGIFRIVQYKAIKFMSYTVKLW